MNKYYIYDSNTDQKVGEVEATSIINAELKFMRTADQYYSCGIYALTTDENEPLA